jgi:hypothetical protein
MWLACNVQRREQRQYTIFNKNQDKFVFESNNDNNTDWRLLRGATTGATNELKLSSKHTSLRKQHFFHQVAASGASNRA